jgi:hypothetical protein
MKKEEKKEKLQAEVLLNFHSLLLKTAKLLRNIRHLLKEKGTKKNFKKKLPGRTIW